MSRTLIGRRAIITGAGSGVGAACARLLAAQGAAVGVLDVRSDAVQQIESELRAMGAQVAACECDVGSEAAVSAAAATVAEQLGGLDAVVTAAGVALRSETHRTSLQEWETIISVNLTGTFLTLKHTLGRLIDAGGGSIVTVGSIGSLVTGGSAASYDASKGGVLQLTRAVAAEYAARNIRANCVCPGAVETPIRQHSQILYGPGDPGPAPGPASRIRRPIERRADPAEIASVVAFLCSDGASFMTGAAVPVDGGWTAI